MSAPEAHPADENAVYTASQQHYLDLIQAIIVRMSAASSTAKSWLLPVTTATFGYALVQHAWSVAALGVFATAMFWNLDVRYLREERAYRELFADAVRRRREDYDLDASVYYRAPAEGKVDCRVARCRWWKVARSWAMSGFYGPIGGLGIMIALVSTQS